MMNKPYTLLQGDCREVMRGMADNSVDAIVTDPPYFKVKREHWDNQWSTPEGFISWLDGVLVEFHRILKPNGSLYLFASPRMAARVELAVDKRFNVLNRIRWAKPYGRAQGACKEQLRSYFPQYEEIIFAEHKGSDNIVKGESRYAAECDKLRGFLFEPLRVYLKSEWNRAGLKPDDANTACGTASMAGRHFFSVSQWCLPTSAHYAALREYANRNGGDHLRREYEDLRREYEDLRREYEDLRRPFVVTADVPYTDTWNFKPVPPYPGKHPCEKPLDMLEHIINSSTRQGAIVLDAFAGHGNTGIAALNLGRDFIGIEREPEYLEIARQRIEHASSSKSEAQQSPEEQLELEACA